MSETFIHAINNDKSWKERMKGQKKKTSSKLNVPRGYGPQQVEERWKILLNSNKKYLEYLKKNDVEKTQPNRRPPKEELFDSDTKSRINIFKDNIENFIGTVKVPVGVAGPLRVNGLHASGDYYIPLATTEAALVASINRGISCINAAGGVRCAVIMEGISRDPAFCFSDLTEAGQFYSWATKNFQNFKMTAEKTTKHGKLIEIKYMLEGNTVHMKCIYTTGDASGQNIVTLATEEILNYIHANCPVKIKKSLVEGGMSGDKKANSSVLSYVRGRRVIAEVTVPKSVCWTSLHASPEDLVNTSKVAIRAFLFNGTISCNTHFANPITAMAIALGQDPACASECHVGCSRTELDENGDAYVAVTLSNILVGTVGGGTKLPSQKACLELMGLVGNNMANQLAEVMAGVILAGEISLGAAVISGDFAKAHKILARDSSKPIDAKDSLQEQFEKAQSLVVKLSAPPPREKIMQIYGLYKQATVGDINIDKPSWFSTDMKSKAKYEAWKKMKGVKKEEAMKQYVQCVIQIVDEEKKKDQPKQPN